MCGLFDTPSTPTVAPAPPPPAPTATPTLKDKNKVSGAVSTDGTITRRKTGLSSLVIDPASNSSGLTIPR